jgi:hypothetical protein
MTLTLLLQKFRVEKKVAKGFLAVTSCDHACAEKLPANFIVQELQADLPFAGVRLFPSPDIPGTCRGMFWLRIWN